MPINYQLPTSYSHFLLATTDLLSESDYVRYRM